MGRGMHRETQSDTERRRETQRDTERHRETQRYIETRGGTQTDEGLKDSKGRRVRITVAIHRFPAGRTLDERTEGNTRQHKTT